MLPLATALLLLAAGSWPAAAVQEPAEAAATRAAPADREAEAQLALESLRRELIPAPGRDASARRDHLVRARGSLLDFAAAWGDADAALAARLQAAALALHALELLDDGLQELRALWRSESLQATPRAQPRLGAPAIGLRLARELIRLERYEEALQVLVELRGLDTPESAAAGVLMQELPQIRELRVGRPLQAFEATDLEGRRISSKELGGRVLLLEFWATHCGPCGSQLRHVERLRRRWAGSDLSVIGVSLDGPRATGAVRRFLSANGVSFPQVYDGGGWDAGLARRFNVRSLPANLLVGRDGVILGRDLTRPELAAALATLLAPE